MQGLLGTDLPGDLSDYIEKGALDWILEIQEGEQFMQWLGDTLPRTDQLSDLEQKVYVAVYLKRRIPDQISLKEMMEENQVEDLDALLAQVDSPNEGIELEYYRGWIQFPTNT